MPHPCANSRYFTLPEQQELHAAVTEAINAGDWSDADNELWNQRWTLTDGDGPFAEEE